jgi:uncharacterized membrane protein YuzA (DUF378 family)
MADKLFGDNELVMTGIWLIVAVAALNWALLEFADFDLLVDGIGLSADMLTATYGVIGAAAAVNLYNLLFVELMEV